MHSSLLYTRARVPAADKVIRVGTGGLAGHAAVGVGPHVIDTTLVHGCKAWDRDEWLSRRVLVAEVEVVPVTERAGTDALLWLWDMADRRVRYDWLEILGWFLFRELGDPNRPVCSGLAAQYFERATGVRIPDRRARLDPRHVHIASGMYLAGLRAGVGA